jgi:hypothetical protein
MAIALKRVARAAAVVVVACATLAVRADGVAAGAPRPLPAVLAAPAAPPATPAWPVADLQSDVRDLLLQFYRQEADPGEADYTFRAPRGEAQKKTAWKDPDTLWEHFGGTGTACHAASSDTAFINCTGHRLARTFNLAYGGGLTLFDAARGYYANDAYAQMAAYYALYHAFVLRYDAPYDSAAYPADQARHNKQYHRRMIRAYEAHIRNIVIKMFIDPAARANPDFQASMTRAVGLLAAVYLPVVQAMEENGVWAKNAADRSYAIATVNGLNQRLFWEWVWPQKDGPRTAGFTPFGSYGSYASEATRRPALVGTDAFFWGTMRVDSLRADSLNVPPYNGFMVDADFTVPGEWWCLSTYGSANPTDRAKCLAQAGRESLGGARSPFGQYYSDPGCASRPGTFTSTSCADTSLGSVAEEYTWSLLGARKGMFLLKRLKEAAEPHTPSGAVGPNLHEVNPGTWQSEYDLVTDRIGFGISGYNGGEGRQDDMEWTWHRSTGAQPIRTLSAGPHDYETQNSLFSLGEDAVSPRSSGRDGDTWADDRQDYPGGMENHTPGPNPLYGTLLFGLDLWDQVDDGAGLARSFYDTAQRNHPDEFASWVWLLVSSYYRCQAVADPLDDRCITFSTAQAPYPATIERRALFADPGDATVPVPYRYLWRDPNAGTPDVLLPDSHIGTGDPTGSGIPTCRGGSGLPWRHTWDFTLANPNPAIVGADGGHLIDEGGFGAYNELVQGLAGFMRVAAARYPLPAPDGSLTAAYDAQRDNVLKPWYDEAYRLVKGILALYRDDVNGYGYVPDIENSVCKGADPTNPSETTMLAWRYGTGATVDETVARRAQWYSVLSAWYLWYDSTWLDVDPDVWIAR